MRKPEQLQGLDSLIIPSGESTTMAKLADYHNLVRLPPSLRITTSAAHSFSSPLEVSTTAP